MVGGGVALGRYAGSWAVFREGNVEQMAPKWLFIPLANSSAVFFSCPGMDILPFFLSMPAICLMVVNHDLGFVVSIWESLDFVKVSLVWMIVRLMVLRRLFHKASSLLLNALCLLRIRCLILSFTQGLLLLQRFLVLMGK